MICNKCGVENPDTFKLCLECGHKLQSGGEGRGRGPVRRTRLRLELLDATRTPPAPKVLRKYLEAWLVAGLVVAVAWILVDRGLVWPFYPLAALAAGYCLLRGITWDL